LAVVRVRRAGFVARAARPEGRRHLNFDEFDRRQKNARAADEVESGEMPLWYALMHGGADYPDADKTALIEGLRATFGED
jgi:hypothetical protein